MPNVYLNILIILVSSLQLVVSSLVTHVKIGWVS